MKLGQWYWMRILRFRWWLRSIKTRRKQSQAMREHRKQIRRIRRIPRKGL